MIGDFFNLVLVQPLFNLLVFFYNFIPDIGVVIIMLTVLVRLLLLPSFHKSLKHQKALQDLQPKMQEVREKYKDDKEQQAKALMELYRVHKVNPLGSCLPLLLQLPILIALYYVFIQSLNGETLNQLYSFVPKPESINPMFLGIINLKNKAPLLAALAGILQYFQSRMMLPKTATTDSTQKMLSYQGLYVFPILTFVIGLQFPAGLILYWVTTTLFGIAQQYYILRKEARQMLAK